tara:strand:- start:411 stop:677 length:267 start_codon:yes stop_codon:yes gene_type:complete
MERVTTKYLLDQVTAGVVVHNSLPKIDKVFSKMIVHDELDTSSRNGDNFFDCFSANRNNIQRLNFLKKRCEQNKAQDGKKTRKISDPR